MSSVPQAAAERPEVAAVRHPIARNNVVGYELRFGGRHPAWVTISAACHSVRA